MFVWKALSIISYFVFLHCEERKVTVTEVSLDSAVEDVQWTGTERSTVLITTTSRRLYRSKDSGRTWHEISDLFKSEPNGEADPQVQSVVVNQHDRNHVIIIGDRKEHFVSDDGCLLFRPLGFHSTIHSIKFHPKQPLWTLISHWTDACNDPIPSNACIHMLLFSRDGGRTYTNVASYIVQYSWGEIDARTEDWIFYTAYRDRVGSQNRGGGWSSAVDFCVTKDLGKTHDTLISNGNKFLVSNGYIFVAKVEDQRHQTVKLFVSTDGGDVFNQAKLPIEVQEKAYTIVDTSEGAIVLHVNHGIDTHSPSGHVYISDAAGLRFSLSLPNNVRTGNGECEFDKVMSLEGVYLANFREGNVYDDDNEVEEPGINKRHGTHARQKSESSVRSVISFDKGGMWSYLKPPKIDSRGDPTPCLNDPAQKNNCYLHLHGITNFKQYAPFYSTENAIGMIMGTGNVGSQLRYEPGEVNTYFSNDGGVNWTEVHKGGYIYEFGDHGGLVVMADDLKKTNQVVFSWNGGQIWYDFDLTTEPIEVDNIVIEPKSSTLEFILYGTRNGMGILYHLDFATLKQPKCQGLHAADSVSSDYETWTATDGRASGDRCILGRQITYIRRKQAAECYNGSDFEVVKSIKTCPCTMEDYECEYGFSREIGKTECRPTNPSLTSEGCTTSSYFWANAYRKIPGDKCSGGWTPPKVAVPCPSAAPFSIGGRLVLWLIITLILVLIAITLLPTLPSLKQLIGSYKFDSDSSRYAKLSSKHNRPQENVSGFIESDNDESNNPPNYYNERNSQTNHRFDNKKFSLDDGEIINGDRGNTYNNIRGSKDQQDDNDDSQNIGNYSTQSKRDSGIEMI